MIIIYYHIFFYNKFTIYLRFNYTCNKKRVQIYQLYFPLCIYYIYSRVFLEHTSCYQYRPLHFVMPCILLKKPKQDQDLHRCYNTVNICRNVKCNRPCSKFGLDGFLVKWQQYPASLCIRLSNFSDLASSLRGIGGFQYGC